MSTANDNPPCAAIAAPAAPVMEVVRMRLHTQHQAVAIMRRDSYVCRAEGLASRSQVLVKAGERELLVQLYQIDDDERLSPGQVALSEDAWNTLGLREGDAVEVRHPPLLASLAGVRKRIYGQRLSTQDMNSIVSDVVKGHYTDIHLAAFLTATSTLPLDERETVDLISAMVQAGERVQWNSRMVVDKHCVGGLPGNRTTPIVVAIATANGLVMPKTSSRAITSPAGTADTMATLTTVDLDLDTLRSVVGQEGGCLAWGGAMRLSPADEMFVRVERALDIDTEGQLIASVLSKKIAAGATHVVIDIPVGPTAKVRSQEAARLLASRLVSTAAHFGVAVYCLYTDGAQPVGRGIGPALEARDVLAVLRNDADAPDDLRQRAVQVAGAVLEIGGAAPAGEGVALALRTLEEGRAWDKFQRICAAQGGLRVPPRAPCVQPLAAARSGTVTDIDNRKLARLAKLAGAPDNPAAGVDLRVRLGDKISAGASLMFLHAQTQSTLDYALMYARDAGDIIHIVP